MKAINNNNHEHGRDARATRRGFTLAEMVMAMAVVAIIGGSVAGVAMALSTAYSHSQDYYQYLKTARSSMMNIQSVVRKARLITAGSSTSAVIWACDTNGDGLANLDEIARLAYDSQSRQVCVYRVAFPATMAAATKAALNARVNMTTLTNASTAASTISSSPYAGTTVLADDVRSFAMTYQPAPPTARVLHVEISVGRTDKQATLRSACLMRDDDTGRLSLSGGVWSISNP